MQMKLYLLLLLLVSCSVFGDSAKIAVVDLKKVASESLAGKNVEKQMKTINNESKSDLLELENQIKSMDSNKKSDLDTRKIEELQVMLYDMVREKKYKISEAYQKAISKLDAAIKDSIAAVCKRKKIEIVIAQDAVVYFDKSACEDVTQDTVKELNNTCPEIKIELQPAD